MVNGTLALLYTVFGLKLGCSRAAAWLAGSEACLAGSWALEGGNGQSDIRMSGRMDVRTDGKSPHSTGLCPLSGPLPRYSPTSTQKLYKAGQGYR